MPAIIRTIFTWILNSTKWIGVNLTRLFGNVTSSSESSNLFIGCATILVALATFCGPITVWFLDNSLKTSLTQNTPHEEETPSKQFEPAHTITLIPQSTIPFTNTPNPTHTPLPTSTPTNTPEPVNNTLIKYTVAVVDFLNEPLPNATVLVNLVGQSAPIVNTNTTSNGQAILNINNQHLDKEVIITARHNLYQQATTSVTLSPNQPILTIQLRDFINQPTVLMTNTPDTLTSTPTATPTPTPTPVTPTSTPVTPTPSNTPRPVIVVTNTPSYGTATNLSPNGGCYSGAVQFSWSGQSGATYEVIAIHQEVSGRVIRSGNTQSFSWSTSISGEWYGNWEWYVITINNGQQSASASFTYDPRNCVTGGPNPEPTYTLPPIP